MAYIDDIVIIEVGEQGPTGQGVPVGGLAGQYLRKNTDGDFDTEWVSSVAGNALAIVSESEPLNGVEGEIWFNPTTKIEKIYANYDWQNTSLDGEHF